MDVVAIVLIVGVVVLVLWVGFNPRYSAKSGLEGLGLSSGSEITERREALEAEDLAEMMEARNARRRARGEPEVSAEDYEMQIMSDIQQQRRRDREAMEQSKNKDEAEREIEEMLEATNARRRARGLPERTREDLEREFGA